MEKMKTVSPFQLFSILFISTVFSSMMYSKYITRNMDLLTYAVCSLIALLCLCVLIIPFVIFRKRFDDSNIIRVIQTHKPLLNGFFTWIYSHYFIYSAVLSMTIFALLLSNFINQGISFFAFFAAVLLCCYYAAFKGLTAISRSGTVFFVLTVISVVFICATLIPKINTLNYSGIFLFDGSGILSGTMPLIAQASSVPALFLFSHRIKSNVKKPVYLWIVLSYISIFFISLISYGVLGEYLHLTPFPFYTATQLTEIGVFQRLDVVFLSLWVIGMFVNVSVSMYALRETIQSSFKAEKVKYLNPVSALIIGIIALIAVKNDMIRGWLFNGGVMLTAFLSTVIVLPAIAICQKNGKKLNGRKAKAVVAVVLVLLFIPLFTGCGSVQLHERLLIKGIGIDGKKGDYSITVQYLDNYSEDEGQSNKAVQVHGATIADAIGEIKKTTGSDPFLGQNIGIVVGWEAAQNDMRSLLDYFIRYGDSRPTVKLFLSETTAEDILTLKTDGTLLPIDQISTISLSDSGGENLFTVLNYTVQDSSNMDTPTVSVLKVDGNAVTLDSVAVFSDKGLYKLDESQLTSYRIVNDIAKGSVLYFDTLSCEVNDCRSVVTSKSNDGVLCFSVHSELVLDVLENPENLSNEKIEEIFTQNTKKMIQDCMEVTVKENKCDIYNLGRNLRMNDYSVYSNNEDYKKFLSNSRVTVNVDCKITNQN